MIKTAERRMFAKTIVLSDAFLDMSLGARCLYMTFGMLADDDGFVNAPKSIMRQCGASEDDFKVLIAKKFVIPFESGVIVIKHWRINNYLQKDRIQPTKYQDELSELMVEDNGAYTAKTDNVYIDSVYTDKNSIDKSSIDKSNNIIVRSDKLSEPKADVSAIPLNDGSEWLPDKKLYDEYVRLYPNVDVKQAFNAMRGWCMSNPTKRKTLRGITKFVNTWLSKEQDRGYGNRQNGKGMSEIDRKQRQSYADTEAYLNAHINTD